MRLNRLDLLRYGRFSDANIAFPRPSEGLPDVTVVFGQNEAGKSTAFNGLLELLFGFAGGKHPYDFRFNRSDLMVGAELDVPGSGIMVLRRNSKRTQSLLDANDRPINEAILSGALYGLTRDQYEDQFSLNEKGLREGGKRIAEAKGDLGQLLHAGLSGLTGMAETLESLVVRADKFHKKGSRSSTVLKTGNARLKEIGRELRADRLTTERERKLSKERDKSSALFESCDAEYRQVYKRQAASEAAQIWYGKSEKIATIEEAIANFPVGPALAVDASQRVASLVEKIVAQTNRITEADKGIAKQIKVIEEHPADKLAVPLTTELDRLDELRVDGTPVMERASTARAELNRRSDERDKLTVQIDEVLTLLGMPGVPASTVALKSSDLEELATAVQECVTAGLSADAAQETVIAARATQGEAPPEPKDLTALRAAFNAWKSVGDVSALETNRVQAATRLTKVTAGLPKTWEDRIDAGLPATETLDEFNREWVSLKADLDLASDNLETRAAELADVCAELSTLEDAPETVDIVKTEETRRLRDIVWQKHRSDLTPQTADQFEEAMYADDGTRARYVTGAEARQRLVTVQGQVKIAEDRYKAAKTRHDGLITQHATLSKRCCRLALALGFEESTPPSAFSARCQALQASAEAVAELSNAEEALKDCRTRLEAARDGLNHEALSLGLDPSRHDLPDQVQHVLTLEESDAKAWTKWQEGEKSIAKLDSNSKQCSDELVQAQLKLRELTAALPLPNRTLNAIQVALPHLRTMAQLYDKYKDISNQIEVLEQTNAALTDSASRLARIMGEPEDATSADPLQTIDSARARVTHAAQSAATRTAAEVLRDEHNTSKSHAETLHQTAKDELSDIFKEQGAQDLAPQERVARLVERDRLRLDKATAEGDRQRARDGVETDLFSEELHRMPDVTRAGELEQEKQDAQLARDIARDAQRDAERLYNEAFETADRADLATEQATILEELRNAAREAAVARLGVLAARGALRRLAAERRSSMLRDVEDAFVTMTAPAWTGVDAWTQAEGEKLVGIQADGSAVPVEKMSTGTMGQLYFALRLAGYRNFAREPGPLPMILDDIMETFDDTRARAALQLCADIGVNGQAVLFTHHAHLVELARDTIDGVAVVTMPD